MNLGLNQSISQRVEQKLQFKLSQKMQQAIKMLLMSRLDLTQHLTQQLEENPFLDEGLEEDDFRGVLFPNPKKELKGNNDLLCLIHSDE